jgi:hypothetical protein
MRLKSFGEAEGYYDNASQIAGKLVNLEYKCDMMEKVGLARWGKRDIGGAVQIWKLGIERCKDGHYLMRWKSILDHMAVLYGENHQVAEQREAQRDALGVQTLMDQGAKA